MAVSTKARRVGEANAILVCLRMLVTQKTPSFVFGVAPKLVSTELLSVEGVDAVFVSPPAHVRAKVVLSVHGLRQDIALIQPHPLYVLT